MQLKEKEINAEQDRSLRNKVRQNYDEHWNFSLVLLPPFWSSPHVSVQALSEKAKNCFEHFHVCVWLTNCSLFLDSRWLYGFNKRERGYISTSSRTKKTDRYGKFHTALKILVVISMFLFKLLYQETDFPTIFVGDALRESCLWDMLDCLWVMLDWFPLHVIARKITTFPPLCHRLTFLRRVMVLQRSEFLLLTVNCTLLFIVNFRRLLVV